MRPRESTEERRHDPLFRTLVHYFQLYLEPRGFQLEGRGKAGECSWVEFSYPIAGGSGQDGTAQLGA